MRFVIPVLTAAFVALAITTGVWAWWWPAAVLVATGIVYAMRAPRAFGKRADGSLPWFAWAAWGPLFVYQWIAHEAARRLTSEPVATEIVPGVWVARRPRPDELPPNITIVVDLCAELPAARGIAVGRTYLSIPTLDATAPTPSEIARAVDAIVATPGGAFIHCAFGHGRSATVAAAVLVRRELATLDDVERLMKARRPRIGLNATQRAALAAASVARS